MKELVEVGQTRCWRFSVNKTRWVLELDRGAIFVSWFAKVGVKLPYLCAPYCNRLG